MLEISESYPAESVILSIMLFKDEQPFLDAISARHQDDGLRLIYADFLEDAGDVERAEFVRVQVALARMTEDHPHRAQLANREQDLRRLHLARWSQPLGDLVADCDFRRGVLDSIVLDAEGFLAQGEELLQRIPLRRVRLRHCLAVLPKLANSPLLARIRELDLCDNELGNEGVREVAQSPRLRELESLDLALNGINDQGVRTLARSPAFPGLTNLNLAVNNGITSQGIIELARSPFFTRLNALDVSGNELDAAGVQAIVSSQTLVSLNALRLSDNHIGDAGVAALAGSPLMKRLLMYSTRVELRSNQIGPDGIEKLIASPSLSRCVSLDITNNSLGDRGLAAIIQSPRLEKLKVLRAGKNQIRDSGVTALSQSWPRIFNEFRILDLSHNNLTRFGVNFLKGFNTRGALDLDLSHNVQATLSDDFPGTVNGVEERAETENRGLKYLVAHPNLRRGNRPNANT